MRSRPLLAVFAVLGGCSDPEPVRPLGAGEEESGTASELTGATEIPADLPAETEGDGDGDPDPGTDTNGDTSTDTDDDSDTDTGDEAPYAPPLYFAERVHSPLTPFVADNLASIRAQQPAAPADVFMKVGASSTVNTKTLHCFADDPIELGAYEAALGETLDFFLLGQAGDTSPFDRHTLAAQVGVSAGWAIEGEPSPLDAERAQIHPEGPSLALIHYGTNDMQLGITYASAMPNFFANMSDLLDLLVDAGVAPIVFGISRRLDSPAADLWVPTYNALIRGLAQARSLPFIDLHHALEPLDGYGISGDGIHLEGFSEGACILTPEALEHGYNVRNLIALEALDRSRRALAGEASDTQASVLEGAGDLDQPYAIPSLPFAHSDSTLGAASLEFDVYSGCDSNADESGPERVYRFTLDEAASVRAMVFDRADVDIDVHIVDESASEAGCIARDDRLIETTLEAGSYYAVLDTYVNGGGIEQAGAYTFVLLRCEPGDSDCF